MYKTCKKILLDAFYLIFRPIWILERLIIRNKNIWIFGAWFGQKYSDNSKWLYEYVIKNNPEIYPVWITKNKDIYLKLKQENKNVCLSHSLKGIYYCLHAKYAFLTNGVEDVNMYFINGATQIWLWHGMPLKKILKSTDKWKQLTKFQLKKSKIINPYNYLNPDYTVSSSDFFTKILIEAFDLPENQILCTGLPRVDAFFCNKTEQLCEDIRNKYKDVKIFFYMPTYRQKEKAYNPFDIKYNFNENEFNSFLEKNNIVILYKPHFVDSNINLNIKSERFLLLNDNMFNDLYILLNSIDALITDYSSVFFDFIPSKKPIFLFPFDYSDYIQNSRSHYFNLFNEMKANICSNWNEFYSIIEKNMINCYCPENYKFIEYLDGNSCKKIVEKIKSLQ